MSFSWWLWFPLILISSPWPAWILAVADALLHSAMSRPLEMPLWRPSPWQPLCLWHQYHHSTANGRGGERMRALTLRKSCREFRRRCNLCNLGGHACQERRSDFWFNVDMKHSRTLLPSLMTLCVRRQDLVNGLAPFNPPVSPSLHLVLMTETLKHTKTKLVNVILLKKCIGVNSLTNFCFFVAVVFICILLCLTISYKNGPFSALVLIGYPHSGMLESASFNRQNFNLCKTTPFSDTGSVQALH